MAIPRGTEMPEESPVSPGEILIEEFLRPMGLSQTEAAARMEMPLNRLNEIVHGRRSISARTALLLSDLLGTTPQFWLNLQAAVDLYRAKLEIDRAPRHRELRLARTMERP
jgi:addiction module HigA family antidote